MVAFQSPVDAIACAMHMQLALMRLDWPVPLLNKKLYGSLSFSSIYVCLLPISSPACLSVCLSVSIIYLSRCFAECAAQNWILAIGYIAQSYLCFCVGTRTRRNATQAPAICCGAVCVCAWRCTPVCQTARRTP